MTVLSWLPVPWDFGGASRTTPYPGNRTNAIAALDDLFTKLGLLDLTQTSDTGQYVFGGDSGINYVDAAANTVLAYRIYRLNDSLVLTHPLFIKIEISVGWKAWVNNGGVFPKTTITVGTATNGAGVITENAVSGFFAIGTNATYSSNAYDPISFQSFASSSVDKAFLGFCFNAGKKIHSNGIVGTQSFADIGFFLERIPNPDGTPSTTGFTLFTPEQSIDRAFSDGYAHLEAVILRAKTRLTNEGKTYTADQGMPVFPQTFISPDYLVNHFYHSTPNPVRSVALAAVKVAGLGAGAQFTTHVYGGVDSNFIVLPDEAKNLRPCAQEIRIAMLWE